MINSIDIFIAIARADPMLSTWRSLIAIPAFGRYTLTDAGWKLSRELFSTIETKNNHIAHKFAGRIHRDNDKPAIISPDGIQYWYQHGLNHRGDDKPAVIYPKGMQEWWQHGKRHRDDDKPAIIFANGDRYWCQNGERHRDGDKPAVIFSGGIQEWYHHGKQFLPNGYSLDGRRR